jgi:pyrroloquinoline-quinone synthase
VSTKPPTTVTTTPIDDARPPLPADQFEAELHAIGEARYHDKHPFNIRMHAGELTEGEFRLWARNRFYYQRNIPVKDAIILTKLPDAADRQAWLRRITDHAGAEEGQGGLEAWLRLGEAVGYTREEMRDDSGVLVGVRVAVDRYVTFCKERTWLEAVASSLTELFAPDLLARRVVDVSKHYPWLPPEGLDYFRNRLVQQPKDLSHVVPLVKREARTRAQQEACLAALSFKCDVLWDLLDAVSAAGEGSLRRRETNAGKSAGR